MAVLTLLLLGTLAALALALSRGNTVQEKGLLTVLHTEERAEGLMVLAEREEKLLQLLCSPGEDRIQAGSRLDAEYRWDRRTGRGTLLAWSLREEALGTPMDEVGASQDLYVENGDALFGFPRVMVKLVSRRPDPEGRGYLSFYVFSAGDDTEQWYLKPLQELVRFQQALGYGAYGDGGWRVLDADDDGIRELLVRTPWPEKPCILYDWEDGTLTATWLDDLPDAMVGPVA